MYLYPRVCIAGLSVYNGVRRCWSHHHRLSFALPPLRLHRRTPTTQAYLTSTTMYGYGLPSPTSSSGQAVTPPGHSRFLPSQGVPTPGAPFMFSRDLPPSPQTPSTSLPHGREVAPFTPLMGYVPLPTMPGPCTLYSLHLSACSLCSSTCCFLFSQTG